MKTISTYILLVLLALLIVGVSRPGQAVNNSTSNTNLDLSQPFSDQDVDIYGQYMNIDPDTGTYYTDNGIAGNLADTAANARATRKAIQARLNYLYEYRISNWSTNRKGRLYLPAGTYYIDRPLMFPGTAKILFEGAGKGTTILRPCSGNRGMAMIMLGHDTYFMHSPLASNNFVNLNGVLDGTVSGKYGLRTYNEVNSANFPATSHWATRKAGTWASGTHYNVGDEVSADHALNENGDPGVWSYFVCQVAHIADSTNEPCPNFQDANATNNWRTYWIQKNFFTPSVFADPITLGGINAATGRATNWKDLQKYTLDIAFVINAAEGTNGVTPATQFSDSDYIFKLWGSRNDQFGALHLTCLSSSTLRCRVNCNGDARDLYFTNIGVTPGLYRFILQGDFSTTNPTTTAWIKKPGANTYTMNDGGPLVWPAGSKPTDMADGFFVFGKTGGTQIPTTDESVADLTLCGLHLANDLRYDNVSNQPKKKGTQINPDDNYSYFTNDSSTIAYLPLTTNPSASEIKQTGIFIPEQHGAAAVKSGDTPQMGFGLFNGIAGGPQDTDVIRNITIDHGPNACDGNTKPYYWGSGVNFCNGWDEYIADAEVSGGAYGIYDWQIVNSWGQQFTNCTFAGSQAAVHQTLCSQAGIRNCTLNPGRYGIFSKGNWMQVKDVTFGNPDPYQTESLINVQDAFGEDYYDLAGLKMNAGSGGNHASNYPSKSAFTFEYAGTQACYVDIRNCEIGSLASGANLLRVGNPDLPENVSLHYGAMNVKGVAYTGNNNITFVRTERWNVPTNIYDCDKTNTHISKWVDVQPPSLPSTMSPIAAWDANTYYCSQYVPFCTYNGALYISLQGNPNGWGAPYNIGHTPPAQQDAWWQRCAYATMVYQDVNSGQTPAPLAAWTKDKAIVSIFNEQVINNPTEARCTASPSTFFGIKGQVTGKAAPSVTLALTETNYAVGDLLTFTATATDTDGDGVERIDFFLDNATVPFDRVFTCGLPSPAVATINWTLPDSQNHQIKARAIDKWGLTGDSSPVVVSIGNQGVETVWVEDALPAGATGYYDATPDENWNWVSSNPTPYSGTLAHQSALYTSGEHQHYFCNATSTLSVVSGETLICYVYLDATNPPSEVMLQWCDASNGTWTRAYWGATNQIGWTATKIGNLPATGQWVRLEASVDTLGLGGKTFNGMAFVLYGGKATWDRAGKLSAGSNQPPVANDDSYWTNKNTALSISDPAGGVLANDTDAEADALTAVLVSGPSHAASFTLNSNGTFNYTPANNYTGTDSFTYKAHESGADSGTATVTITISDTTGETVWVEDALPTGATGYYDATPAENWNWITSSPSPYTGSKAHQSALYTSGEHQHYFCGATSTLSLASGNTLFCYVYLDATNPPSEVMLQFYDNTGTWTRAYWGASNPIGWTATQIGGLPPTGRWVRLEVPVNTLGLAGKTLNGMAYVLYGGKATWDRAGKK